MHVPEELRYTKEHEWASRDGNVVTVGITDYAQGELGDIVFVELPAVGESATAMQPCGVLEAVKTVADLYAPLSGTITAVNDALNDSPDVINKAPYGDGWIVRIELADPKDFESLMTAAEYTQLIT